MFVHLDEWQLLPNESQTVKINTLWVNKKVVILCCIIEQVIWSPVKPFILKYHRKWGFAQRPCEFKNTYLVHCGDDSDLSSDVMSVLSLMFGYTRVCYLRYGNIYTGEIPY